MAFRVLDREDVVPDRFAAHGPAEGPVLLPQLGAVLPEARVAEVLGLLADPESDVRQAPSLTSAPRGPPLSTQHE